MNKTFGIVGGDRRQAELARLLLGCGLTAENIAVDLLCVGVGVCLYRTVRDNFAEPRVMSRLARG